MNTRELLEMFLFTADAAQAVAAQGAGITSVIVDWENQGSTSANGTTPPRLTSSR